MEFAFSDLGNCNCTISKEAKSPTRNVKISVKRITKGQTEASRIERLILKRNGPINVPNLIKISDLRNLIIKLNQIHKITNRN